MASNKPPRVVIYECYQRLHKPAPRFETVPSEAGGFKSALHLEALDAEPDSTPSVRVFHGTGNSKKVAEAAAAASAWAELGANLQAVAQPVKRTMPLTDIVIALLHPETAMRDAEAYPYVLMARQSLGGWLPLSVLCLSRPVKGWYKDNVKDQHEALQQDRHAWCRDLRQRLLEGAAGHPGAYELSEDGLCIRLTSPPGVPAEADVQMREEKEADAVVAVYIPADDSVPLREVLVPVEGCLLHRMADALGLSNPLQLMLGGRVGRPVQSLADPRARAGAPSSDAAVDAELAAGGTAAAGSTEDVAQAAVGGGAAAPSGDVHMADKAPSDSVPPAVPPAASDRTIGTADGGTGEMAKVAAGQYAASNDGSAGPASGREVGEIVRVSEPSLYCSAVLEDGTAERRLNLRASWLAGGPVYGDALLSLCRAVAGANRAPPVVKWRHFRTADWWRAAMAYFPAVVYLKSLQHALVQRLPHTFSSFAAWHPGPLPTKLLDGYVKQHAWRVAAPVWDVTPTATMPSAAAHGEGAGGTAAAAAVGSTVTAGAPADAQAGGDAAVGTAGGVVEGAAGGTEAGAGGGALSEVSVAMLAYGSSGTARLVTSSGPSEDDAVARERAALAILHHIQRIDALALTAVDRPSGCGAAGRVPPPNTATACDADVAAAEPGTGDAAGAGVHIVERGEPDTRQPAAGLMAKISYKICVPLTRPLLDTPDAGGTSDSAPAATATATGAIPAAPVAPDAAANVDATAVTNDEVYLLERGGVQFELGVGAIVPQLEEAVMALCRGGTATCRLDIPLEGHDPLGVFETLHCTATVTLLKVVLPEATAAGGGNAARPALFSPPLSQQRYELVAEAVRASGARCLVDLGCGEGRLLEYLLKSCMQTARGSAAGTTDAAGSTADGTVATASTVGDTGGTGSMAGKTGGTASTAGGTGGAASAAGGTGGTGSTVLPLRHLLGVDVSTTGLSGAAKRLERLTEQQKAEETATSPDGTQQSASATVTLIQGSALTLALAAAEGGWGGLAGCDMATFVEVVEHLDAGPLTAFGPAVLGGLRPRVLVVTTPNWEYNAVMRAAEAATGGTGNVWPGPPGRDGLPLRNNDHRFEWTRAEFESWARGIASQFEYDVRFEGIGRLSNEAEVLASSHYQGRDPNPGCSSQAAIFTRKPSNIVPVPTQAATLTATATAGASSQPQQQQPQLIDVSTIASVRPDAALATVPTADTDLAPAAVASAPPQLDAAGGPDHALRTALPGPGFELPSTLPLPGGPGGPLLPGPLTPLPSPGGPMRCFWGPRTVRKSLPRHRSRRSSAAGADVFAKAAAADAAEVAEQDVEEALAAAAAGPQGPTAKRRRTR